MATHKAYRARQLRADGRTWAQVAAEAGYSSPDSACRAVRELEAEEATTRRLTAAYAPMTASDERDGGSRG